MNVRNLGEMGVNLQKIYSHLCKNKKLIKLLYFTDKDPLQHEDSTITDEFIKQYIYNKLLLIIPYIPPEQRDTAQSKVSLQIMNGNSLANDDFTQITFSLQVFVPLKQWIIKNSNLRPFAIMGEILNSLNGLTVNGLGRISFNNFSLDFLTEEMSCYSMEFNIIQYE